MPTVEEILIRARELVARPGGWRQGDYGTPDCCCLIGAVNIAAGLPVNSAASPRGVEMDAYRLLERATGAINVAHWNDERERTVEDVLSGLDRAIALARSASGPAAQGDKHG